MSDATGFTKTFSDGRVVSVYRRTNGEHIFEFVDLAGDETLFALSAEATEALVNIILKIRGEQ